MGAVVMLAYSMDKSLQEYKVGGSIMTVFTKVP
jgi:hypothetical protein